VTGDDTPIRPLPLKGVPKRGAREKSVPEGKLEMVITYLEMRKRPARPPAPHRAERLALMRAERPLPSFYRYLYNTVGGRWLWYERRLMDDRSLCAVIHDPAVEVYVLYVAGNPAGFFELDCRDPADIEIAYFGLLPEFIGRGLGRYLLDWAIDHAWSKEPERLWVHTCNLDHPHAIAVYQRAGFEPYRQERKIVDDPRRPGSMPAGQEFEGS